MKKFKAYLISHATRKRNIRGRSREVYILSSKMMTMEELRRENARFETTKPDMQWGGSRFWWANEGDLIDLDRGGIKLIDFRPK